MTRRRRWVALGALVATTAVTWSLLGSLRTAAGAPRALVARAHEGSRAPSFDEPIFVLLLGGDSPKGNPTRETRTDSIHILSIDPKTRSAAVVGIPRDWYVPIPGHGSNKVTTAAFFGGPELAIRTIEEQTGCRFDYFALTNFTPFVRMIDEFGGIPFTVARRMFERGGSRIDLHPGPQVLDGVDALAYARDRHNRPNGDLDRSFAQGELIVALLKEARARVSTKPGAALKFLGLLRRHVHMDVPLEEALKLGLLSLKIDPNDVRNVVAQGDLAFEGEMSVVRLNASGRSTLADVCDDGVLNRN